MTVNACTSVTTSFLAHARVLAYSLAESDPTARLTVLVVDARESLDLSQEPFRALRPSDLDLEAREYRRMAAIYDAGELCAAVRPWVMRRTLDEGGSPALWLDADVLVFSPLADVAELADRAGVVLVPHAHEPIPRDGLTPTEQEVIRAGPFSGGLIGVPDARRDFLAWWQEPLARDCVIDTDRGLFREKNWLTFVPCYFEHTVLGDPTVDVTYWTLAGRELVYEDGRYLVGGRPLRSFHFTGFDPERPDRVSVYEGPRPRVRPAQRPGLARLLGEYAERVLAAGYSEARAIGYGYDRSASGIRLTRGLRTLYRRALIQAERDGGDMPDPFDSVDEAGFKRWLEEPPGDDAGAAVRAGFLIERGALPAQGSRFGAAGRSVQGAVLRALRGYSDHQREVDRALLRAIAELERNVERLELDARDEPDPPRA